MLGTNLDEGRFLMPATMPVPNAPYSSVSDLQAWLVENYPKRDKVSFSLSLFSSIASPIFASLELNMCPNLQVIETLYQAELKTLGPWGTAAKIYTDSQYTCPTLRKPTTFYNPRNLDSEKLK